MGSRETDLGKKPEVKKSRGTVPLKYIEALYLRPVARAIKPHLTKN
jgi:hypothetical protein